MVSRNRIGVIMRFFWCVSVFLPLAAGNFLKTLPAPVWSPATATWYGSPDGDGTDGGACGYEALVDTSHYRARVTAGSSALFQNGLGCGACYKVRCLDTSICSRRAITVIVADRAPEGPNGGVLLDLSGGAFGRMAVYGESSVLEDRGAIPVQYRRTPCKYGQKNMSFRVVEGSTAYYLAILAAFVNGDGDIGGMEIRQGTGPWMPMTQSWGAIWSLNGVPLRGPMSVRITTLLNKSKLTAFNVIPADWNANQTYIASANFVV